ncbi:hypothetical protein [Nocardioides hankookensis]|uniref:Uncharacterized protein n=1 Tax=Nocardioides hankookensis TaxID=443157 RepID=A0ABW1LIL0_9ACTN
MTLRLGTRTVIAAVAAALTVGLVSAPSSAGSPPGARIRPADLPMGAAPRSAWYVGQDKLIHLPGGDTVALPDKVGDATTLDDVWRVHEGWLAAYSEDVSGDESQPPDTIAIVGDDGRVQDLGTGIGYPAMVAEGGRWFVTSGTRYDQGRKALSTDLKQVRVTDGRMLAKRTFVDAYSGAFYDYSVLQAAGGRVLLEKVVYPTGGKAPQYRTMWWTPSANKVSVLWSRAQQHRDQSTAYYATAADVGSTAGGWATVREGRARQAVRDLRTHRLRWTLPKGDYALAASPNGAVLLTTDTARPGGNGIQTLRARDARTGRLLSSYRVTIGWMHIYAWESPRVFLFAPGNRIDDQEVVHGTALVRCTLGTVRCQRVTAAPAVRFPARQNQPF